MYECVIDFRLMNPSGLADARRGFRSVIHRAEFAAGAALEHKLRSTR